MKHDPKPVDRDETPEYPLPSPTDALRPEQILPDANAEQEVSRSGPGLGRQPDRGKGDAARDGGTSKRAKLLSLVVLALVSLLCFSSLAQSADGQKAPGFLSRPLENGSGNGLMLRPGALGGNGAGASDSRSRADDPRGSASQAGRMGSTGVNGSVMGGGGAGGGTGSAGGGTGGPGGGSGRAGH